MNYIAELLEQRLATHPDHTFLYDELTPKGVTYARCYELSGRVYAYLKALGVGKEDFVLIKLPRGVQPVLAMYGVWRAGAAWALVEDTYAPDRIEFIRKDCNCRLVLDSDAWDAAMKTEPLDGYADVGEHDAAYAVYTSGSTGNPKGVLHEYGNIPEACESLWRDGKCVVPDDIRFACPAPLNFVAATMIFIAAMRLGDPKLYIVSYATVKNPMKLAMFMLEKRISGLFMTPSYVRAMGSKTGPFLKYLLVGSEPANDVDPGKLTVFNVYAMSESGFAVGLFRIDRAYDTCPIGRPTFDKKIYLLDENGREVPEGEMGELCFDNPFVRGYINLPEQTAAVFKNGVYHSGDLAKRLPGGDYVLLGRNTDMVKINGNRIEPAEVEAAVKAVLGVDWCAVRGFEDDAQAFLAAYYTADIPKVDTKAVRERLSRRLPYYMLPQYFVKIDSVPKKATGKLDRKALPKPDTSDYVSDYVAPSNATEAALCKAMAKALKMNRLGVNDDFYELGGDSLASMQVITSCGLKGLNASDIFRGRTPKAIAELYLANRSDNAAEKFDELDAKARTVAHPLTVEQTYMVDYQMYTPLSTMYNLFTMIKVEKGMFEPEALAAAVTKVLRNHPAFATTFSVNDDGEIEQSYHPEIVEDVRVEKLSQFDFEQLKDDLVKPYKIIGSRLYRCRLFETEKALYLYFDVHHTIFDGTSFKVLVGDIAKAVSGEELDRDYYYLLLSQRETAADSPRYAEAKRYFESAYGGDGWTLAVPADHESRENRLGELAGSFGISHVQMKSVERALRLTRNEFFMTAYVLSIALASKKRRVKVSWFFNGREDVQAMSTCGLLFRDLPVALELRDERDIREIYADVQAQVRKGIENSLYPYNELNASVVSDDLACFLYQSDIHDGGADSAMFEQIDIRQNKAASQTIMDTEVIDGAEGVDYAIHYAACRYDEETVKAFAEIFRSVVSVLAGHLEQSALTFGDIRTAVLGKTPFLTRLFGKDW